MITVLRLGHRLKRDERISTHVGLVARAFSAGEIIYSGDKDGGLIESVTSVAANWGGSFAVRYEKDWRKILRKFKGCKVHLTIYGMPVQDKISEIRKVKGDLLIIVGGEKVPGQVYEECDYNIAVTQQPHSEVAALAIFLHELQQGKELDKKFIGGKLQVIPQEHGK
ncbi:MAG: tRNA (cytidine(56)-2'-O)-methyltransferase, partial [Candidatus Aenigmatarchaeota archaeon]